jgi:hypothetical protein
LLAKLSGDLASANINFFAIGITKERALEFMLAAQQKGGDHVIDYMRLQFAQRFGFAARPVHIHFIDAQKDVELSAPALAAIEEQPAPVAPGPPAPPPSRWDE